MPAATMPRADSAEWKNIRYSRKDTPTMKPINRAPLFNPIPKDTIEAKM